MSIDEIIEQYQSAKLAAEKIMDSPNYQFDNQSLYKALDAQSHWTYLMINHDDWTIELADKYYPSSIGEIPYPKSC